MAAWIADAKSILLSKTFWGAVITLVATTYPALFQHVVAAFGASDPNSIAAKIVGVVGALIAIYGRFVATQPVTLLGSKKPTP